MKPLTIRALLASQTPLAQIRVSGWVRTRRDSKAFSFLEINDGSCLSNLQCILDSGIAGYEQVQAMATGSAVTLEGELIPSLGKGQQWELKVHEAHLIGEVGADFPLQKKGHTPEFLRTIAHLRPRTNLFGAVFRMRSFLSQEIHRFFAERDFFYVHTPIITQSDCEGAGEMFRVTTQDPSLPQAAQPKDDFFGTPTYLTVSGQLEGEAFATALSRIYTFGPTFRAENSHTSRHAAEFWMVEPEMAFCDLEGDMELAEEMLTSLVKRVLDLCQEDLSLFSRFVDKGLLARLEGVGAGDFERLSYTDAITLLQESKKDFSFPVAWGVNLQSEHERFLTESYFKKPVTVYNYPKEVKPFYMRSNDDGKTVTAMDVLVPEIGEIIGGAQREERLDILLAQMQLHGVDQAAYQWYIDTRRYGSCPHAGFGLGLERLLMFVTGVKNIRDVIPFARTPGHCAF